MVQEDNSPGQELKREQERGGATEEERSRRRSTETRKTELAMTISVAKEATIVLAGNNGACSNGRNRENKCSSSKRIGSWTEYGGSS